MSIKLTETPTEYILEGECECPICKGTGLYKGMGEKGGARVICTNCDGSGKRKIFINYQKFKGRKKEKGCVRVYTKNMGYTITDHDVPASHGNRPFPFSKYGCTYEEWLKGANPVPLKFLGCPHHETDQRVKNGNLYITRCKNNLKGCGLISDCKLFYDKEKCWKIFDKQKDKIKNG